MAGQKTISTTHKPPNPNANKKRMVTENGFPSPNGRFFEDGVFDGQMSYANLDKTWFIFYHSVSNLWFIMTTKSLIGPGWKRVAAGSELGLYEPYNLVTGNPIVIDLL